MDGKGDTISMGATSIVLERILDEGLSMEEILEMDYEEFIDSLGREAYRQPHEACHAGSLHHKGLRLGSTRGRAGRSGSGGRAAV